MKKRLTNLEKLFIFLWISQALVNLIGALGPELGFDTLWYHLTEAKLFLRQKNLDPIPGNLLYWSGLPRLTEAIFAVLLPIGQTTATKLFHYFSGLLSSLIVFKLASKHYSRISGLAAALLFYTTLLVGWLSTTSYIDLTVVLVFLFAWIATKKLTRTFALIILGAVKVTASINFIAFTLIPWPVLGVLPFMIINYQSTGNPFYPFFEHFNLASEYFFNGFSYWLSRPLRLFIDPAYRVGPAILLIILFFYKQIDWGKHAKILIIVFTLWWLGPGTGFGRFALIFISALSILVSSVFSKSISKLAMFLVIIQAVGGICLRLWANSKYLPVIFNKQTKADFLAHNLQFDFGDFYDIDGWFSNNISSQDKVLVYYIHNLYYLDFPFDHHTFSPPDTNYTHILVGDNQPLPKQYSEKYTLIYQNPTTRVSVYKRN